MNAKASDVICSYNGLDGGGADTLLPVQSHKPARTALHAVKQPQVPVKGDTDRGVVESLVEGTAAIGEGPLVLSPEGSGGEGTVLPLGVEEARVHLGVTSYRKRGGGE